MQLNTGADFSVCNYAIILIERKSELKKQNEITGPWVP